MLIEFEDDDIEWAGFCAIDEFDAGRISSMGNRRYVVSQECADYVTKRGVPYKVINE